MRSGLVAIGCVLWVSGAGLAGAEDPGRAAEVAGAGSAAADSSRHATNVAVNAKKAEDRPARADQKAQAAKTPLSVYVPPSRGAVGARTGGGSRGATKLRIAALVPDHVGLTTREQPTLAWFLSADSDLALELTLIADGAVEPSAVLHLPGPQRAGIHRVDLAERAVRLEPGTTYEWTVALVRDAKARDQDVIAGGAIRRASGTPELVRELSRGEPSYRVLARNGIWYDAIADLSTAIAAAPDDAALRAERAGLLEQVGMGAAAQYDRVADPAR